jgi:phosphatidylserine/phosphatidylglycerophosphate/cardiolipin synthase-like enzyme
MRFKNTEGLFRIYAVTGTHTIAFAIDCEEAAMKNLLGFTIEKEYKKSDGQLVRVTVMGFKVFKDRIENPVPGMLYSTFDQPIQSFMWEDFSSYPNKEYSYHFTPLYDDPINIRRSAIFSISVKTEKAWKENDHSVFFNRGVASSQAYAMKFGNDNPDEKEGAYEWLSRGLKEAILTFIGKAKKGDKIFASFYEFRHDEILSAFREAAERDVELNIVYDAKENESEDPKTHEMIASFPKVENEAAIKRAKLDQFENVSMFPRDKNKSYLSHNKFMILESGGELKEVWTGSTNISKGGIFGQANVGHHIDDKSVATHYKMYWDLLKSQPATSEFKAKIEVIQKDIPAIDEIPLGVTSIFSPRKDLDTLKFYADLLDSARDCGCITFAFNVDDLFANALSDNDTNGPLTFMLLEKDDADISDYIYKNNVIKAVGSYIGGNELYRWVRETNTKTLKINNHVMYIHTKFLLRDPLSDDPIVVTGSANFSKASTVTNDENMVIIRGNTRVADIYFTEFFRLFNHYYFRWIARKLSEKGTPELNNPAFLSPDDKWTEQYKHGKFKRKRVQLFVNMKGAQER